MESPAHLPRASGNLLLVETSGTTGSIALGSIEGSLRPAFTDIPGRTSSECLLPAIRTLLAESRSTLDQLAAISVVHGPGSFTGIRVGLAAAKGLCEALGIPLIAISRLAVLAASAAATEVLALLDAGRGELYCGHYRDGTCAGESLLTREAVLSLATSCLEARLVGCQPAVLDAFPSTLIHRLAEPTAASAFPQARARFAQAAFDDVAAIDANYVRRTDLEIFAKSVRPTGVRT